MTHTKGPWVKTHHVFIHGDTFSVSGTCNGKEVVVCGNIKTVADLYLIGAAPEMLEALEKMLRLVELDYEGIHCPDVAAKIDEARKAIKNAKGGK